MDLPTYTNIWRIEKRLYKLYDFRLPAPLPITWIGVFAGITVPYVVFLIAVGLPFNHNLVWLYVLPPGVLTWLTTRPVIESKRLPELVSSQLRYVAEPRTWCRMAPFAEKDEILVTARVWHSHPPKARPKRVKKAPAKARSAIREPQLAAVEAEELAPAEVRRASAGRPVARPLAARQTAAPPRRPRRRPRRPRRAAPRALARPPAEHDQVPVQERAPARRDPQRAKAQPAKAQGAEAQPARPSLSPEAQPVAWPSWSPWPYGPEPDAASGPAARPGARDGSALGVDHLAAGRGAGRQGARGRTRLRHRLPRPGRNADLLRPGILALSRGQPAPAGPSAPGARPVPRGRPVPRSRPVPGNRPVPRAGARCQHGSAASTDRPHPAPSARPAPTPAPRRAPGPGPACRSGTCPA